MLSVGIVPIHESTYGDVDGYNAASMLAPSTTKEEATECLLTNETSISFYGNLDASRIRQERKKRYAYHQDPNNALRRSLDQ
jgi:hypothetical protein